jgi:hypothetical protein
MQMVGFFVPHGNPRPIGPYQPYPNFFGSIFLKGNIMSSNQQATPAKNDATAPAKKDEQSKNPVAANTPNTDKSADKR